MSDITAILFKLGLFGTLSNEYPAPCQQNLEISRFLNMLKNNKFLEQGWRQATDSASKLSAFIFITPLFGVVASYFIMHENLTLAFGAAALLVMAGLYLVNKPSPVVPVPIDPLLNVTKT